MKIPNSIIKLRTYYMHDVISNQVLVELNANKNIKDRSKLVRTKKFYEQLLEMESIILNIHDEICPCNIIETEYFNKWNEKYKKIVKEYLHEKYYKKTKKEEKYDHILKQIQICKIKIKNLLETSEKSIKNKEINDIIKKLEGLNNCIYHL